MEQGREEQRRLADLMRDKEAIEYQQAQLRLAMQRSKKGYGEALDASLEDIASMLSELKTEAMSLDDRIRPLVQNAAAAHNPRWGLMMRAGNDKSQLARQVERYADVYTSRVANLLYTTPFAYLRSVRGSLPHDPASL